MRSRDCWESERRCQSSTGSRIRARPITLNNTVDPASWQEHGGNKGMIKLEDGKLFVAQTPANQKAVSDLLAHIRAEKK